MRSYWDWFVAYFVPVWALKVHRRIRYGKRGTLTHEDVCPYGCKEETR